MTYLELVNGVLMRMREDTVNTLQNLDDPVVEIVAASVNDAKRTVEDAHSWSMLQGEWNVVTTPGTAQYVLTNSSKSATIEYILGSSGRVLRNATAAYVRRNALTYTASGTPEMYAVVGADAAGDIRLQLQPPPATTETLYVYGKQKQAELSADDDVLAVPSTPVLYLALALAARERGEVGGQTAAEIFQMANRYLSDAIALDAALSFPENIWYV